MYWIFDRLDFLVIFVWDFLFFDEYFSLFRIIKKKKHLFKPNCFFPTLFSKVLKNMFNFALFHFTADFHGKKSPKSFLKNQSISMSSAVKVSAFVYSWSLCYLQDLQTCALIFTLYQNPWPFLRTSFFFLEISFIITVNIVLYAY